MLGDLSLLEEPRPLGITLQEYRHQWLATDVALRLEPATMERYTAILRKHWLPELGNLPLSGIIRERVKIILQGKLMERMQPNMARIMLTVLRATSLPEHFRCLVWIPLLKRAGLRYCKPHTLHHPFASMLIQAGESLAYVKEQLGHSSIIITVATYAHLIPGANKAAVDRLDDATRRNPRATGVAGTLRVLKGGRAYPYE